MTQNALKKLRLVWLVAALVVCSVVVFRKNVLLFGAQWLLSSPSDGRDLSYAKMEWENDTLVISQLALQDPNYEIAVDKVAIDWKIDWTHLRLEPQISLVRPQVLLVGNREKNSSSLPLLLIPHKRFKVHMKVEQGILCVSDQALYFSLSPGQAWESIGTLTLSYDPDPDSLPLLRTEVHRKRNSLEFSFYVHEQEISQITPLWTLLPQTQSLPWQPVEGSIEITGSGALSGDLTLKNLSCHGSVRSLSLSHRLTDTALTLELLEGSFTYPTREVPGAFWENGEAELVLRGGKLHLSPECSLSVHTATCHVQNDQNPQLSLEGSLSVGEEIFPLTLTGQGSVHSDGSFWLDLIAKSCREETRLLDAYVSCCSPAQDQMIFQINCEHADLKSLLPFISGDLDGTVQGKLTLCMENGTFSQVNLDAFSAEGFYFHDLGRKLRGSARSLTGDLALKKSSANWDLKSCALKVQEGRVCSSSVHVEIEAEVYAKNNHLMSSLFNAKWGALTALIEVHDPEEEAMIDFTLEGDLTPLTFVVDPELLPYCQSFMERATQIQGTVRAENNGMFCQGAFLGNETLTFGLHFSMPQTLTEWNFWKLENGWIRAEHLSERTYGTWLEAFDASAQLFGDLDLDVAFNADIIDLTFLGKGLCFSHPKLNMQELALSSTAHVCYDRKTQKFRGQIPFLCALLSAPALELPVQNLDALLQINGSHDHLSFEGNCAHFDLPLAPWLTCHGKEWKWSWEKDLLHVHTGKAELFLPEGKIYALELKSLQGNLSNASFDLNLRQSQREVARIQGELKDKTLECTATLFQCTVGDFFAEPLPLGPVSGKLLSQMHPTPTGFGFKLETSELKVKDTPIPHTSLSGHKTGTEWVIDHFQTRDFLLKAAFSFSEQAVQFSRLEGKWKTITAKGSGEYRPDLNRLYYRIDAAQGELGNNQGRFHLAANTEWDLPTSLQPMRITGEATCALDVRTPMPLVAKSERPIRFVYSEEEGLTTNGLGLHLYLPSTSQHIGSLTAESLVHHEETTGIQHCAFSLSRESVQKAITAGYLPSGFSELKWESYLEGAGDLTLSSSGVSFQGELKDGLYGIKDRMFPLSQILLNVSPTLCSCRFKTQLGGQPVWGQVQVDLTGPAFGVVKLVDHPTSQGLTAVFKTQNDLISWEKIQGNLLGVSVNLAPHPSRKIDQAFVLTGKLAIDHAQFYACLPEKIRERCQAFAIGPGYQFEGDLQVPRGSQKGIEIHGVLTGKDFELFGITFEKLDARLDATNDHLWISQLKIQDDAGVLFLKKLDFHQTPLTNTWEFQIPLIQVKEVRPSLFKKQGELSPEPKPFVIKNLSILDVKGNANDPLSWEGRGDLNFINAFKKETSLLDLPLEIIKNFGLDPGLLTPVQGEVDFELRGDKFYLLNMKNAYSEGKRSQFFLALDKEISFIGLDGKLQIDLAMRQDVVLKLTEAFTLKIRGTLDKPRYGLQY
jgi:hypothetical protein